MSQVLSFFNISLRITQGRDLDDWILKRGESYKDPALERKVVSSREA